MRRGTLGRINVRNKGAAGERELAEFLYLNLPIPEKPQRNLEQVRSGGGDLLVPPFLYECKRVESLSLGDWWYQAVIAGQRAELEPIVAFRQNKRSWEFLISAKNIGVDLGFMRVNSEVFFKFARPVYINYIASL